MDNERYFTSIRGEYREAIDFSAEVYTNIAVELDKILRGRVVDFGNGGVINYATVHLDRLLCVDLVGHGTPDAGNVAFTRGDFYDYGIPAGTDCVLAQFLLHHLADDRRLDAALARMSAALGARGRLVVVEMLMPRAVEAVQLALRPVASRLLQLTGRPDLRFFSRTSLLARLRRAGFEPLAIHSVDVGRRIAPAPVLFPALRIPGRLYPLSCVVIEAAAAHGQS